MSKRVLVGDVVGAFGVLGWVKVKSYTDPIQNILGYSPWLIDCGAEEKQLKVLQGRQQGLQIVANLAGVSDRDQAAALMGTQIFVPRESFPKSRSNEYYWADLVGLEVDTVAGLSLGKVIGVMETGANDVLEVKGDRVRMIPFVLGQYVKSVDLDKSQLVVDWDLDF